MNRLCNCVSRKEIMGFIFYKIIANAEPGFKLRLN